MTGDPVLVNLAAATFNLTGESGIIVESADVAIDAKFKDVFDASKGYDVGFVAYNFAATRNCAGILNGVTGLPLAQPGVALALANDMTVGATKNGVGTTGGIYTRNLKFSHQGEDLRKFSVMAMQKPGIA